MIVANNTANGADGVMKFLPPYSIDKNIRRWSLCLDPRRFASNPARSRLTVVVGCLELETDLASWRRCWKHWSGGRAVDDQIHCNFMDMPFARTVEVRCGK